MYVSIWRKWKRGKIKKTMKHILEIENMGCSLSLSTVKRECDKGKSLNNRAKKVEQLNSPLLARTYVEDQ